MSEWLAADLIRDPSARHAVEQIGTNGIPILLEILGIKSDNRRRVLSKLKSAELRREFKSNEFLDLEVLRGVAVEGFEILGTNAAAAVPQIVRLLDDVETVTKAADALTKVGPKGFSALTNTIADPEQRGIRNLLIDTLAEQWHGDQTAITKMIVAAIEDSSPGWKTSLARHLKGQDPELAIPALIRLLDSGDLGYVTQTAAAALASYGSSARAAVPKLLLLFTNKVVVVGTNRLDALHWGKSLMGALKAIDGATAAEAEAFLVRSGPLNYARDGCSITQLKNGRQLVAGGCLHTDFPAPTNRCLSSAELYDPAAETWTETGEMGSARYYHIAVLLQNGKVLVAGGQDLKGDRTGGRLSSAELYDPKTGRWAPTGSMVLSRHGNKALIHKDGKVLIYSDGWDGTKGPSGKKIGQELYDPVTEKWTALKGE
jgi:hypothetical protein